MDMMSALCRDFGLPGFSAAPTAGPGQQSQQPQPMETAFQIIQRYLLDGDTPTAPSTSASNPSTEALPKNSAGSMEVINQMNSHKMARRTTRRPPTPPERAMRIGRSAQPMPMAAQPT